ncbi:MAG: NAD-dependent epimerase/dehydratase family protein, partial [Gammaproteobacteria bacterium]|nr:NAD-dependent epimerase/dehydratase family protein [Gammaproteobacteria bacterium]
MSKEIQRVCIVGGSGFVGRHIAARLIKRGYEVCILTRQREKHRSLLVLPELELIQTNPYDADALARNFRGAKAVINLVGILNERGFSGKGFRNAHVELTRKVVS